jgi:hypothetical protein
MLDIPDVSAKKHCLKKMEFALGIFSSQTGFSRTAQSGLFVGGNA